MSTNYERFEIETPQRSQPYRRGSGCFWGGIGLGCVGVAVLICGGFVGMVFWGVTAALKSSDAYQQAVEAAKNSPEVQQALGSDIEASWPVTGSLNMNNDHGEVDITIPLKGSEGSGNIRVKGTRDGSVWSYEMMEFTDSQGKKISIMKDPSAATPELSGDEADFKSLGN